MNVGVPKVAGQRDAFRHIHARAPAPDDVVNHWIAHTQIGAFGFVIGGGARSIVRITCRL